MKYETTCGAFLKQLRVDHQHFDLEVFRVRNAFQKALEQPLESPTRRHVAETLQALRDQLVKHFKREENEGCLWEAASYNAALCEEVKRVIGEHPSMLSRLDDIIASVEKNESRAQWAAPVLAEFDKLARVLAEHETRETAILEKALPDA